MWIRTAWHSSVQSANVCAEYMTPGAPDKATLALWQRECQPADLRRGDSVPRAADAEAGIGDSGRVLDDLPEAHHVDDVVHRHRLAVDRLRVVDHLVLRPERGAVVL